MIIPEDIVSYIYKLSSKCFVMGTTEINIMYSYNSIYESIEHIILDLNVRFQFTNLLFFPEPVIRVS